MLLDQAKFFRSLYAVERAQPEVVVHAIEFDGATVKLRLASGGDIRIPLTVSTDELYGALGGKMAWLDPPSESQAWSRRSTVGAQWAELHYDLGATGPRMHDFNPRLAFQEIRLIGSAASVTIRDEQYLGTATVDLASVAHDMGLPIELAEAFVYDDRPALLSRVRRYQAE